jgi:hypothetical protein
MSKMSVLNKTVAVLIVSVGTAMASMVLSGGVNGSGTIQSAIPMPQHELRIEFGSNLISGSMLGLKDSNARDTYSDSYMDKASRRDYLVGVGYGILPFLEAGLLMPFYGDNDGLGNSFAGTGDLRTSFKLNYPPYPHPKGFELSLLAQFDWPTSAGEPEGYNRHAWYMHAGSEAQSANAPVKSPWGSPYPVALLKMMTTANFGAIEGMIPLLLHLNWGMAFSESDHQNAFLLNGGAEITPHPVFTIFWSFDAEVPLSGASKSIPLFDYPISSAAGLQFQIPDVNLEIAGGALFAINQLPSVNYRRVFAGVDEYHSRVPDLGFFIGISTVFDLQK